MKIAYVYDAIYPFTIGGVEKRIAVLSERLAARGHEIHIIGLKSWEGDPSFFLNGIHYHGIGRSKSFYAYGRRSITEALYFGYKIIGPLIRDRFDIIDCQNFPYFSCFSAIFASGVKKTPIVITWHEVWNEYWYEYLGVTGAIGRAIEKCISRLSDNLVAVSESTKNDLLLLNPHASVTIIPNGIDFQRINAVQPSEINSDIIFIGRLIREKKPNLLIEALVLIKKEIPDVRCIIVGDGPEQAKLTALSHQHHLEKNIQFMRFLKNYDDVIALMKASKVFASPSIREGFGMAALEALACGLPVVTSNSPQNAVKGLVNEKTGIVCILSPEALAESIVICLKKKDIMTGECKRMAKLYDWDLIVEQLERKYSDYVKE